VFEGFGKGSFPLNVDEKLKLVERNTEEIVTFEELRSLLKEEGFKPKAYWGFEPSGLMHLGTGLVCGYKILDLVEAGFDFTIFLADWHAWINGKLGGSMENIRFCGEYLREGFTALGLTPDRVHYRWASELAEKSEYWETLLRVAKNVTLPRVSRALPILGRQLGQTDVEFAWLIYPCMQVTDIFMMGLDCACAGIDQRKAHMLARDVAGKLGFKKPVCVHTHLLPGLQGPKAKMGATYDEDERVNLQIEAKMSKSQPKTCIYVHDPPEEVERKLRAAYCPPRMVEGNPVMEIAKYIIFGRGPRTLKIPREEKYGGPLEVSSYEELEKIYVLGKLHPLDLKNAVAEALNEILEPFRKHFKGREAMLERMMELEGLREGA